MISDVDDELVALFKQHPNTAVLSALGGPHRAVYAPWLNPVHPLILETVLPEQIKRLQGRFPADGIPSSSSGRRRPGIGWPRHLATERCGRQDRRRHRRRRAAGRSVHRLDDARGAGEHGDGRHSAGARCWLRRRARRPRSSASTISAWSPPARAPTSSCSTRTRSTTSRTRGRSRACTCAVIASIEKSCERASWLVSDSSSRLLD